jgi:hypothetical protein
MDFIEDIHYEDLGFLDDFILLKDVEIQTEVYGRQGKSKCGLVEIFEDGRMIFRKGFRWKASGPTIDTPPTRRASLVHDGLYVLRHSEVMLLEDRNLADLELYRIMIEDGCCEARARLWYLALREFGLKAWDKDEYYRQLQEWEDEWDFDD